MANANLLEMARDYLSPELIRKFGSAVGESPERTQKAFSSAIPAVTGGFVQQASSDPSGTKVMNMLAGGQEGGKFGDFSMADAGSKPDALMSKGQGMLGGLFGDRLPSAVDHVASSSGLSNSSAAKILALAAPIMGMVVSREAGARKLGPAGIASMLASQKSGVASALGGGGLTSIFGGGDWSEGRAVGQPIDERQREVVRYKTVTPEGKPAGRRIGLPLVLLGLLGLLAVLLLLGRSKPQITATAPDLNKVVPRMQAPRVPEPRVQAPTVPTVTPPGMEPPTVTPPAIGGGPTAAADELNRFFANPSEPTPKRIPLEGLTFEHDSDQLTASGSATISSIATTLKAHPTANVRVEGFTDNSGDPDYNRKLSADRANAVRDALTRQGVEASRLTIAGNGPASPVAPNDMQGKQPANRRVELVVTSR